MARFERQIEIKAPAEKVFSYLADIPRHSEWAAHRLQVQQASSGAVGAGSTFSSVSHLLGEHKAQITITEFEPNAKLGFEAEDDTGHFRHWFLLESADGGTRVTKGVESQRLSVLFTLLSPLTPLIVPRGLAADLKRIKAKLEEGGG